MKQLLCAALVLHAAAVWAQPNETPGDVAATKLLHCRDCATVESVIERKHRHAHGVVWITTVRMKDGRRRVYEQRDRPAWGAGGIVHVRGRGLSPA
ncbi:MAG: hypothetical protein V4864_06435 [Pseudomonadota bacterium]